MGRWRSSSVRSFASAIRAGLHSARAQGQVGGNSSLRGGDREALRKLRLARDDSHGRKLEATAEAWLFWCAATARPYPGRTWPPAGRPHRPGLDPGTPGARASLRPRRPAAGHCRGHAPGRSRADACRPCPPYRGHERAPAAPTPSGNPQPCGCSWLGPGRGGSERSASTDNSCVAPPFPPQPIWPRSAATAASSLRRSTVVKSRGSRISRRPFAAVHFALP